ncbi:MAG: multicopper oxidase domain-containing protein [Geobacter sp.]|nr:multicopper oxidase domain-containing protein [Geobacter sp.]
MHLINRMLSIFIILAAALVAQSVQAEMREYDLTIAQQDLDITGTVRPAMTVNGGIPGPTLRFTEGDLARIRVHNTMSVESSIHWHGLLVPPGMDGVPLISFPPIAAGATFTYEFPIRQNGTYWYHSHTNMQEQSGVYGAIVIEPRDKSASAPRDFTILFSDWIDADPSSVIRTLKRGSEWYALKRGSAQSIFGAARLGMLGSYFSRELQRMPAMDIADVAYDRYLANGKPEIALDAKPGETLRLRIVDGSATSFFHLEFAGGPVRIIAADGQDVEPLEQRRFLIGVAETYDLLLTVPDKGAYEFRATSHDGSGHASVWIGSGQRHAAPNVPKPNLYMSMGSPTLAKVFALTPAATMGMTDSAVDAGQFDQTGMMGMGKMKGHGIKGMEGMDHTAAMPAASMKHGEYAGTALDMSDMSMDAVTPMQHDTHTMPGMKETEVKTEEKQQKSDDETPKTGFGLLAGDVAVSGNLAMDGMDEVRPWPPYSQLRSIKPTTLPAGKPLHEIRLTLDGDMQRYVWFINNKALSESDSIQIREGEIVRFIMINRTMMHHPMHLHGHFFRVINGQGDHSPLKHTVDVAPMSTTVIEFEANEVGDWFFHCHLLYHMKAGMARLVHYDNFTILPQLEAIRPQLYKDPLVFFGEADFLSNRTEGFLKLSNTRNILTAAWEVGWQIVPSTEWELLLTWDRYINRFFSVFAGADLGNAIEEDRAILGIRYLLLFNVELSSFVGSDGRARFVADRSFQLTPRLALNGQGQYDTDGKWEYLSGLSYAVSKDFSLRLQWHSDYGLGGGVQVRF